MNRGNVRFLFSVVIFLAALWLNHFLYGFGASGFVLPGDGVRWVAHLQGLLLILAGSVGVPLVAEWIAFGLSKWLEKDPLQVIAFSWVWLRGVILFLTVTFACALGLILAGRTEEPWAPFLAAAGLMVLLLILRTPFQWIVLGRFFSSGQTPPGRFIGATLAIIWNLMGLWLASLHEQASFFSASGLVLIGFGFAVPVAVGYVLFSLAEFALARSDNPFAKWNVSGTILYLSWFCFGFIARLTPTTLGRPERWLGLVPADRPKEVGAAGRSSNPD